MKHPFGKSGAFVLEGRDQVSEQLVAYALDHHGNIVDQRPVSDKGDVNFAKVPDSTVSMMIAPVLEGVPAPKRLDDLKSVGAYEPVIKIDPRKKVHYIKPIPDILVRDWFFCRCRVRGRLVKKTCFNLPNFPTFPTFPGELAALASGRKICFTQPVCTARVHVCRLTRRFIQTLPVQDLYLIRDNIIKWTVKDIVKGPFGPVPPPIDPIPEFHSHSARGLDTPTAEAMLSAKSLSGSFVSKINTDAPELIRLALDQHFDELVPVFPFLDLCSILYRCDEIMVINVDDQGRFDEGFWHKCSQTQNLYFWVEYLFDGNWITVYKPRLCRGTYWNFDCGDEVTIEITDRRVRGCRPVQSRYLDVTRIGTEAYIPMINRTSGLVSGLSLTDGGVNYERPFGKLLHIHGIFGSALPDPALATHYRVRYRLVGSGDAGWQPIKSPLSRVYRDEIEGADGITRSFAKGFPLLESTPDDDNGYYIITKDDASTETRIPTVTGLRDRDWAEDEYVIAQWDTSNITEGDYELSIEFALQSGGTIRQVTVRRELFQMPKSDNYNESELASNDYLLNYNPAAGEADGFIMRIRVDNRKCTGTIENPELNTRTADENCGLLFTDLTGRNNARLGFVAAHPADKGTYSFYMVRGNGQTSGLDGVAVSGILGTVPSVQYAYNPATKLYRSNNFDANTWISAGACASGAAFATTLHVYAMATDGTSRINEYDAYAIGSFAIIQDCDCAE
jgi:hypothetical protein